MDFDPRTSVTVFLCMISRRLDGILLIILIALFWLLAILPDLAHLVIPAVYSSEVAKMRLPFFMMPFALVGEYLWFLSSAGSDQHSFLICAVLLVTASIPFIQITKVLA